MIHFALRTAAPVVMGALLLLGATANANTTVSFSLNSSNLTDRALRLQADLEILAGEIGERNMVKYDNYMAAKEFLIQSWQQMGYTVETQKYEVKGTPAYNLYVTIEGSEEPDKFAVVGAHYDSVEGAPGANDNGSGVVGLLELSRLLRDATPKTSIMLVMFANEEPPYFQKSSMGSLVFAKSIERAGVEVVSMLSLETMGYYSDERGSQKAPFPLNLFYPDTGNFIGVISNNGSASLAKTIFNIFKEIALIPAERASLPSYIPGIGWSDHWSFWKAGYKGVMLTDTAPYRYPYYHTEEDTPDKIQYDKVAQVVEGVYQYLRRYFY